MTRTIFPLLLLTLLSACPSSQKAAVTPRPAPSIAPSPVPDRGIPEETLDEVDALVTALFVDDFEVRAGAAMSLGEYGPAARRAIPYLVDCVISEDEPSEICADSLGRVGPLALPSIERILAIRSDKALLGVQALDAMAEAGFEVPEELIAARTRVTERPGSSAGG